MKGFRYAVASIVIAAGSLSALCYASAETARSTRTAPDECNVSADASAAPGATSTRPALTVGVSDPNTKLNLPWFLTDLVNAVNTHQSPHCLMRALRNGI
ncbi:hypothetical protein AB1286_04015 [Trinickia sp. NRRL B-1857]|uniref:hypothetical protein n=1 Tax=Trinickia sp. NRRL B-1857 TaxID=3162879 RepID=UPI003D2E16EC